MSVLWQGRERRSGLGFVQKTFLVLGISSLVWHFLFGGTSPLDFIFGGTSPLGSLQQVWSSLQENDGSCGHLWLPLFLRKWWRDHLDQLYYFFYNGSCWHLRLPIFVCCIHCSWRWNEGRYPLGWDANALLLGKTTKHHQSEEEKEAELRLEESHFELLVSCFLFFNTQPNRPSIYGSLLYETKTWIKVALSEPEPVSVWDQCLGIASESQKMCT